MHRAKTIASIKAYHEHILSGFCFIRIVLNNKFQLVYYILCLETIVCHIEGFRFHCTAKFKTMLVHMRGARNLILCHNLSRPQRLFCVLVLLFLVSARAIIARAIQFCS